MRTVELMAFFIKITKKPKNGNSMEYGEIEGSVKWEFMLII
jgi:hypothetical protein